MQLLLSPRHLIGLRVVAAALLLNSALCLADQKPSTKEGWLEIHSPHFTIFTDAGEKRGREVALRFEQMRSVLGGLLLRDKLHMATPLEIFALKSDKDYARVSPVRGGAPISAPGFLLADEDRFTIVLNLFEPEPWRAINHPFTHMLLDANYPATQPWFDEGFAEYFASVRVDNKQVEIGGDPELNSKYQEDLLGNGGISRNVPKSLTELLTGPLWLNMTDLFHMRVNAPQYAEGTHHTMFYAQSWIMMHYLLKKGLLPQAGTYFDLVQNQKVAVPQAVQQAFGMSPEQLEKSVKDYFQSLMPLFLAQDQVDAGADASGGRPVYQIPEPVGPDDFSPVIKKITDDDAHALVAELLARQPEHREEGIKQLQTLAETVDNEAAHRALAFAYMQKKDFKQAAEQLSDAEDFDAKDIWVRYYRAVIQFKIEQATGQSMEGALANVQQNLKGVVDWNPDFAEAQHLLGLAQLKGGGAHAALDSMLAAVRLSPRNETYMFHLGEIYFALKKWESGQAIFERLRGSQSSQIASASKKKLDDLPFLKKYGIPPDRAPELEKAEAQKREQARIEAEEERKRQAESDASEEGPKLKERGPDKRPVQFLKGKIVRVDCSGSPVAIVTFSSPAKTLKLRVADYKSMVVVGADAFSCDWRDQPASVNYKAAAGGQGDVVSIEVR